jgi:hypothetical protein
MSEDRLQAAFREWVRGGMQEPAPGFDLLRDSDMFLPADVIEILARERRLSAFWTYGQAVRQLAGDPPDPVVHARTREIGLPSRPTFQKPQPATHRH